MRNLFIYSGILIFIGCSDSAKVVSPVVKQVNEAVYASGILVSEEEFRLMSSAEGTLAVLHVKEGDTVNPGQLLLEIEDAVRKERLQGARSVLEKTSEVADPNSPSVLELQRQLELAVEQFRLDSLQYARYRKLFEERAISKSQYEQRELQFIQAGKNVQRWKDQVQSRKLQQDLQYEQAKVQWQQVAAEQDAGRIRSSMRGTVFELYKQEGDYIGKNQAVALIGRGEMLARLLVDEDDLGKVKLGQAVKITLDAFPGEVYEATITRIYPTLSRVEQSFRVDARFKRSLPVLMYGLNLEANILTRQTDSAWLIPRKALLPGNKVRIKRNGKVLEVQVKTGVADQEWIQVLEGIDRHSQIILEP